MGLDIGPDEDVERATGLARFALTKLLRYAGPPGQPIIYDDWLEFCTIDAQYNDRIEVFRDEDGWRCDVTGRDGAVRYSANRDGRTPTPLSYLTVCNQARDGAAYVAYGFYNNSGFISRGWYTIPDGSCSKLPLNHGFRDYVYFYATTDNLTWAGDWRLCVHPSEPFEIGGADNERCGWVYVHYNFADIYARGDATVTLGPRE
ncbi:MAG: DUF1036 domain-containing protein [Rhodomicrobium sp.]|nr:DUF1036 domain-containing protein [Rhodomicrobium sp.]